MVNMMVIVTNQDWSSINTTITIITIYLISMPSNQWMTICKHLLSRVPKPSPMYPMLSCLESGFGLSLHCFAMTDTQDHLNSISPILSPHCITVCTACSLCTESILWKTIKRKILSSSCTNSYKNLITRTLLKSARGAPRESRLLPGLMIMMIMIKMMMGRRLIWWWLWQIKIDLL